MNRPDYDPNRPNGAAVAVRVILVGIGFSSIVFVVLVFVGSIAKAVCGS